MEVKKTLITKPPRTMKLNKFATLESGLRPKGGVGGILDGIPSLGGEHLNADGGFIFEKIRYIPEDFFEVLNKGHIYRNDIIVVKDGATTGKTSFVDNDFPHKRAVVNEHLFIVRVDPKVAFPKYVFYCLFSSEGQKQILSDFRGATVGGISRNFPLKVNVPIPSMSTQTQIANYLDRKTEQIDELIRIKERWIELLQEQRTALINQAVTKGLDPNVEMKPSGVEWIGEIPAHWEIEKIKYIATFVSAKSSPETDAIKISPENVESNTGKVLDFYSSYDSSGVKFQVGDVLFNKIRVYLNKVVFAEYDGYSLGEMIVIRPSLQNISKFLFYLMLSSRFIEYCNSISRGAKMPRTDVYDILNAQIPITSYQEQTQIVNFLDSKTQETNKLISAELRKIELLKEYRQSLISEAVTGKIDVRNEV